MKTWTKKDDTHTAIIGEYSFTISRSTRDGKWHIDAKGSFSQLVSDGFSMPRRTLKMAQEACEGFAL